MSAYSGGLGIAKSYTRALKMPYSKDDVANGNLTTWKRLMVLPQWLPGEDHAPLEGAYGVMSCIPLSCLQKRYSFNTVGGNPIALDLHSGNLLAGDDWIGITAGRTKEDARLDRSLYRSWLLIWEKVDDGHSNMQIGNAVNVSAS